jgi:hypothetical protein
MILLKKKIYAFWHEFMIIVRINAEDARGRGVKRNRRFILINGDLLLFFFNYFLFIFFNFCFILKKGMGDYKTLEKLSDRALLGSLLFQSE